MKFGHNNFIRFFSRFWRFWFLIAVIFGLSFLAYRFNNLKEERKEITNATKSVENIPEIETPKIEATTITKSVATDVNTSKNTLPESALIKMPFTTQSPLTVWDAVQEEACEEASLVMVFHYLNKTSIGTKSEAEKEILNLIGFEQKNGFSISVTLKELSKIAKSYYNLDGKTKTDISIDDIKKEISLGNPVIVPAAGKILPNPNFRNGGPIYHMLVIKGYDKDGFITNDPGTRKGENFRYTFSDLFNAIHDWDPENILNGQKTYLTLL